MSGRNARKDRKMEVMSGETDARQVAEEMAASIRKMAEDRDSKAAGAKEHLVSQLGVTADKYRTANGVMSALDTLRDVLGSNHWMNVQQEIEAAKSIAGYMSGRASEMGEKAAGLEPAGMGSLCDGFYSEAFSDSVSDEIILAKELMVLQLCQNVGPSAQDIADFVSTADAEIAKSEADLDKHCSEHGIDRGSLGE